MMNDNNNPNQLLMNLNDYCLLEIFSSKILSLADLHSLADTCKRFQLITQLVFPKGFSIERHRCENQNDFGYIFKAKDHNPADYTLQNVERTLRNFGQNLSTLKLDCDLDAVNPVAKYCDDVTLKRLEICRLNSVEGLRIRLDSIFQRLLELSIQKCDLRVASSAMNCASLIELEIVSSSGCIAILINTFPKLERFTWNYSPIYERADICANFIRRHSRLKTINLKGVSICTSELLHVISSACAKLVELTLGDSTHAGILTDFSGLQSLARLRMLDLDFEYTSNYSQYVAILQASKWLETVKLSRMHGTMPLQIFEAISQLTNLRELHMIQGSIVDSVPWILLVRLRKLYLHGHSSYSIPHNRVCSIIKQLPNLEEMQYECVCRLYGFDYRIYLSGDDFLDIVKIVEAREHVLTLICYIRFNYLEFYDDNHKVRLIKLNKDDDDDDDDYVED